MVCAHWIRSPKYSEVRVCVVKSCHASASRGDSHRRRRKARAVVMLANRFLVRGAVLTASIALLWDVLTAWPQEDGGHLNVGQGDADSCGVSDAYQPQDHWGISYPAEDECCEVDSTSWFPFTAEICPASRLWPDLSLEHSTPENGSGLILRSTEKSPETSLLLRIVQEIIDLCYMLDAKNSLRTDMGPTHMHPRIRHSSRSKRDILELMDDLQGCVHRLRNESMTATGSSPWRQRFQPLQTFAERYVPNTDEEVFGAPEIAELLWEDEVEPGELLSFAEAGSGARILAANGEARKPHRAIDGKSDTFLFNVCKAREGMWLIMELSDMTRVKVLELVMRELYSSRIATFAIFGRLSGLGKELVDYPGTFYDPQWQSLGEFVADNVKGSQRFPVNQGSWIKYFGLHFISDHGPEAACTINEIKVFGVPPDKNDLVIYDVATQETEPGQSSSEGSNGDADLSRRPVENALEQGPSGGDTTMATNVGSTKDADADSVGDTENERHMIVPDTHIAQESINESPDEEKVESVEALTDAQPGKQQETAVAVAVPQEVVLELRSPLEMFVLPGEPPAVAAYRKVRQEVQTLRRNTSMIATYVDTMRSGLMDTIDELWMAIARVENRTAAIADDIININASVLLMHKRLDDLEATAAYNAQAHVKCWFGAFGVCFGIGGLLLSCKYFRNYKLMFISVLSIANLVVGGLNFIAVLTPSSSKWTISS